MNITRYFLYALVLLSFKVASAHRLEEGPLKADIRRLLQIDEKELNAIIAKAKDQLSKSDLQIVDVRARAAICQLLTWYASEVLKPESKGTLDHLLIYLLNVNNADRIYKTYEAQIDLKENLAGLGFDVQTHRRLEALRDLFEHGLIYRALQTLLDGGSPAEFIPSGNRWRKLNSVDRMNELLQEKQFRKKTLILLYFQGLPTQEHVYSLTGAYDYWVLRFNSTSQRWEVQNHLVETVLEYEGKYQLIREKNGTRTFGRKHTADTWNTDFLENVEPEEGEDYIVVHLGNFYRWSTRSRGRNSDALGFEDVNFDELFKYEKDVEQLPGILTFFHCNFVRNFSREYLASQPTFHSPRNTHMNKASYSTQKRNFPISSDDSHNALIYFTQGTHLELSVKPGRHNETDFLSTVQFYRRRLLRFNVCLVALNVIRPATLEDWNNFFGVLRKYLKPNFTPRIADWLGERGIRAETADLWTVLGQRFIQNSKDRAREDHEFQSDIRKRTKKQMPFLARVRRTMLHNDQVVQSLVIPHKPSSDRMFEIFDVTRKQFIADFKAKAKQALPGSELHRLVEETKKQLDGVETLEDWEELFDDHNVWPKYLQLEVLAEIYNRQIFLYELDGPVDTGLSPESVSFVPLSLKMQQEKRVMGHGGDPIHIGVVNAHFLEHEKSCILPFQFEELIFVQYNDDCYQSSLDLDVFRQRIDRKFTLNQGMWLAHRLRTLALLYNTRSDFSAAPWIATP